MEIIELLYFGLGGSSSYEGKSVKFVSVIVTLLFSLVRYVILAGAQGCRFIVRYINAGVSDLDRVNRLSREYLSVRRTFYI